MNCVFCSIVSGEIPATIIARNDDAVAFADLNPQAPTHILVVPTRHLSSVTHLAPAERAAVLGSITALAAEVAAARGLDQEGYRLVINTGKHGGQSVDHLHVHLLGGRAMHWPPG